MNFIYCCLYLWDYFQEFFIKSKIGKIYLYISFLQLYNLSFYIQIFGLFLIKLLYILRDNITTSVFCMWISVPALFVEKTILQSQSIMLFLSKLVYDSCVGFFLDSEFFSAILQLFLYYDRIMALQAYFKFKMHVVHITCRIYSLGHNTLQNIA